jgi:apolipoprotein N-acyltransferase
MQMYGNLAWPLAAGVALLLVAYLALYPALFALVVGKLYDWLGLKSIALVPAVWVTTEFGRGYLLTGFPWVLLGYSQERLLPIAQFASLFGVFGVSGLVAGVNAALACFVVARTTRPRVVAVIAAVVAVAGVAAWGQARLNGNRLTREGELLRVALIQGNIAQNEKWDAARARAIFQRYLTLSREAAARGATLLIWPESSTPFDFEEDPVGAAAIRQVAIDTRTYLLIGSDQVERGPAPRYYNAAFLVGPDGRTLGVYRKMHLVPFGEYIPLKRLLFFAAPLVENVADFSPGTESVLLPVNGAQVSTSICYEVVYPDLVRRFVLGGARLLTTITNDAWYGWSSAAYQHFEQAAMRAIESGRYLARSANTGISGIVDPYGRVLAKTPMFETEVVIGEVRLLSTLTLYTRIGDVFAHASIAMTLLGLVAGSRAARRRRRTILR